MHLGARERTSIRVGGLGEAMRDWIIMVPSEIAREVLAQHGISNKGVQFVDERESLLHIGRELEISGQGTWAPGGPVSNTLYAMGICQESRATPLSLYWLGTVGSKNHALEHVPNPIDSLRRVSIIPYCITHEDRDGLAICVVARESKQVMTILVHSTTRKPPTHPDWPTMDVLIMLMRGLTNADEALLEYVRASHSLALLVGDGLVINERTFAPIADLASSGVLKWIIGRADELARLSLLCLDGVHSALGSIEIVGTQGADPVIVWDPYEKRVLALEIPAAVAVTGDDLGAGDAYAGGYLYNRILHSSIKDAHAFAAVCAERVLEVNGARVEAENDLNLVFGHLIGRTSSSQNEGDLYDRVRITPGVTLVSCGQTGVDQLGLRAASQLGLPAFCVLPQGRRTEVTEGILQGSDDFGDSYIVELGSVSYRYRTWVTAFLADGTLIWDFHGSEGSAATRDACRALGRPFLDLAEVETRDILPEVVEWANRHSIRVLNIAGNRGSLLSEEQRERVRSQSFSILRSLAWNRAQLSTTDWESQHPELAGEVKKNGTEQYAGLRIGFPNVTRQRALFDRFLYEAFRVRLKEPRQLVVRIHELDLDVVFARPRDLPIMLQEKLVDLIFCGSDLLDEEQVDALILLDTGLFPCLLVLVGRDVRQETRSEAHSLRIGSQYPSLAVRLLPETGSSDSVLAIHGTAEAWINIGAIDAAVNTWRTGATADANGLDLVRVFRETSFVAASLPLDTGLIDRRSWDFVQKFEEWLVGEQA